jgi:hypothetical protein
VALFPPCVPVALEDLVDELPYRAQLRPFPFWPLSLWRQRARQCLPHHPSMDPQLLRHRPDRPGSFLAFPPDLLE